MDDSSINILNTIVLHGGQAKAAFLFVLFVIFAAGFSIGHRVATNRCVNGLDKISAKMDIHEQSK